MIIDPRPAQCRFRLQEEGKAYPRSGCAACGRNIGTGLGIECLETITKFASAQGTVAWLHVIVEPGGNEQKLLSFSEHNPWSHWMAEHREKCAYSCTRLAAALEPAASPPSPGEVREALRAIYEWYDRDGSVGGASSVFEEHRSALASDATANSKAGYEDVRGALADLQERFNQLHTIKDIHAEKRHEAETALEKAVADRDALRNALTDLLSICRPGGERTPARAIYDRARTLATPETEKSDEPSLTIGEALELAHNRSRATAGDSHDD